MTNQRPSVNEYVPAAKRYVDLVPDGDLVELLQKNKQDVLTFFQSVPAAKDAYRYAPGKWTPKEMLLHIADAERVFSYRALTIARGDFNATFPNMDEELFAANTDPSLRTLADVMEEFSVVREASIFLFKYFTEKQLVTEARLFNYTVTPKGFGYILVGHTLHHINILKERYL